VHRILPKERLNFVIYGSVTSLILLFSLPHLNEYYLTMKKQNWRGVARYIDKAIPKDDTIRFLPTWTSDNYFYYSKDKENKRILEPAFSRNNWWVVSHGYLGKPPISECGKHPFIVKRFTGVEIWKLYRSEKMDVSESLKTIPLQIKKMYRSLPDNSVIYINNLEHLYRRSPGYGASLNKAVQDIFNNPTIMTRSSEEFKKAISYKNHLFFDLVGKNLIDRTQQVILRLSEYSEFFSINWDFDGDLEGWRIGQDLILLGIKDGILRIKSTGTDPIMDYQDKINIPTVLVDKIQFRSKVRSKMKRGYAQLFWITSDDREWGSNNKWINIEIIQDDEFHDYTIDLLNNQRFKRERDTLLVQLRFDPAVTHGDIEIDYIRLSLLTSDNSTPNNKLLKYIFWEIWKKGG
jgi:hypothetical protein